MRERAASRTFHPGMAREQETIMPETTQSPASATDRTPPIPVGPRAEPRIACRHPRRPDPATAPAPRSGRSPALHQRQQRRRLRVGPIRVLAGAGPARAGRWDGSTSPAAPIRSGCGTAPACWRRGAAGATVPLRIAPSRPSRPGVRTAPNPQLLPPRDRPGRCPGISGQPRRRFHVEPVRARPAAGPCSRPTKSGQ
jgi:hypothetical protein